MLLVKVYRIIPYKRLSKYNKRDVLSLALSLGNPETSVVKNKTNYFRLNLEILNSTELETLYTDNLTIGNSCSATLNT